MQMTSAAAALSQARSPPSSPKLEYEFEHVHLQSMLTAATTTSTIGGSLRQEHIAAHSPWLTLDLGPLPPAYHHLAPRPDSHSDGGDDRPIASFPADVSVKLERVQTPSESRSPSALLVHNIKSIETVVESSANCRPSDVTASAADVDKVGEDEHEEDGTAEDENVHARRDPASPPQPAVDADADANALAITAHLPATLASRPHEDAFDFDITSTATSPRRNTNTPTADSNRNATAPFRIVAAALASTPAPAPASTLTSPQHGELLPALGSHPHPHLLSADMSPGLDTGTGDVGDRRASESYDLLLLAGSSTSVSASASVPTTTTTSTTTPVLLSSNKPEPQQEKENAHTFAGSGSQVLAAPALSQASREAPPSTVVGAPLQRVRPSATSDGTADDAIAVHGRGGSHAILRDGSHAILRDGSLGGSGRLDDTHTQGSAGRGALGLEEGGRSQALEVDVAGSGSAGMDMRTLHTRASLFLILSFCSSVLLHLYVLCSVIRVVAFVFCVVAFLASVVTAVSFVFLSLFTSHFALLPSQVRASVHLPIVFDAVPIPSRISSHSRITASPPRIPRCLSPSPHPSSASCVCVSICAFLAHARIPAGPSRPLACLTSTSAHIPARRSLSTSGAVTSVRACTSLFSILRSLLVFKASQARVECQVPGGVPCAMPLADPRYLVSTLLCCQLLGMLTSGSCERSSESVHLLRSLFSVGRSLFALHWIPRHACGAIYLSLFFVSHSLFSVFLTSGNPKYYRTTPATCAVLTVLCVSLRRSHTLHAYTLFCRSAFLPSCHSSVYPFHSILPLPSLVTSGVRGSFPSSFDT